MLSKRNLAKSSRLFFVSASIGTPQLSLALARFSASNSLAFCFRNDFGGFRRFFSSSPTHVALAMPALSPTMEKGNIAKWNFKVGDKVGPGDILCDIETDKASVGFEMQEEGYLAAILYPQGSQDISVNTPIAVMVDTAEDVESFIKSGVSVGASGQNDGKSAQAGTPSKTTPSEAGPVQKDSSEAVHQDEQEPPHRVPSIHFRYVKHHKATTPQKEFISPSAKRLALELGIPLTQLKGIGSGPGGRVISQDIERLQKAGASPKETQPVEKEAKKPTQPKAGVPSNPFEDSKPSQVRQVIAKRLVESKIQLPHTYMYKNIEMDALMAARQELLKKSKTKISLNDMVIKAIALANRDVPEANSQWNGESIREFKNVDVSVAVDSPNGLITPIVFGADKKTLEEIAQETKRLIAKAREGALEPKEFIGGTITVSNMGMMGVSRFSAIINPPQACILAVGTTEKKLIYDENAPKNVRLASIMTVCLSADNRVVDASVGARWLDAFRQYIESPILMAL